MFGVEPQYDFANGTPRLPGPLPAPRSSPSRLCVRRLKKVADVILPIGLLPEIEATLTNVDGTVQTSAAGGKLPVEARPGWRVLRALDETLASSGFDFTDIAGLRARAEQAVATIPATRLAAWPQASAGLERIVTAPIYRGDAVLRRSTALNAHPLTLGARAVAASRGRAALGLSKARSPRSPMASVRGPAGRDFAARAARRDLDRIGL